MLKTTEEEEKKNNKITFLILASITIPGTYFFLSVLHHAIYDNNNMKLNNTYNKGKKDRKKE